MKFSVACFVCHVVQKEKKREKKKKKGLPPLLSVSVWIFPESGTVQARISKTAVEEKGCEGLLLLLRGQVLTCLTRGLFVAGNVISLSTWRRLEATKSQPNVPLRITTPDTNHPSIPTCQKESPSAPAYTTLYHTPYIVSHPRGLFFFNSTITYLSLHIHPSITYP